MNHIVTRISSPDNPLTIGQVITDHDLKVFREAFGESFNVHPQIPIDYISGVNGDIKLQNELVLFTISDGNPIIEIPVLGFIGSPEDLLRKHGLLFHKEGFNTLFIKSHDDDFDFEDEHSGSNWYDCPSCGAKEVISPDGCEPECFECTYIS